ncbi:MAG: class I SAM-dependent methyltransferase [bacterium]
MKYYDVKNRRLAIFEQKATSHFWDDHWDKDDLQKKFNVNRKSFIIKTTEKYLESGTKILEGGCGLGDKVHALSHFGYDAFGIDYAERTVKKTNTLFPNLKITCGDVRKIPFPNEYFDGYWSLGVIEHFYDGYTSIIEEMNRVIKKRGYLFLTFPYMSLLRKLKAMLNKYDQLNNHEIEISDFYQFMLNKEDVITDLEKIGFELIQSTPLDAVKGMKDEISLIKPVLQKIYDSNSFVSRLIGIVFSRAFKYFSGHTILLVLRKI